MTIKYLLDENLPREYQIQLRYHQPNLNVIMIGDVDAPKRGTQDPEILIWCEEKNYILVTNNRRSMPVHLKDHLAQDRHSPGIFVFRQTADMGRIIEDLILVAIASFEDEYRDRISFFPL